MCIRGCFFFFAVRDPRWAQTAPIPSEPSSRTSLFETGYRFSDGSWLQPDVSVIWPDQKHAGGYFSGAPMLAVEVGSRGNTSEEMDRKIARYFAEGADEAWVVHQKSASLTVYRQIGTIISSHRITGSYTYKPSGQAVSVPELLQDLPEEE